MANSWTPPPVRQNLGVPRGNDCPAMCSAALLIGAVDESIDVARLGEIDCVAAAIEMRHRRCVRKAPLERRRQVDRRAPG